MNLLRVLLCLEIYSCARKIIKLNYKRFLFLEKATVFFPNWTNLNEINGYENLGRNKRNKNISIYREMYTYFNIPKHRWISQNLTAAHRALFPLRNIAV